MCNFNAHTTSVSVVLCFLCAMNVVILRYEKDSSDGHQVYTDFLLLKTKTKNKNVTLSSDTILTAVVKEIFTDSNSFYPQRFRNNYNRAGPSSVQVIFPNTPQAFTWTNVESRTHFSQIWIKMQIFSFKKIRWKHLPEMAPIFVLTVGYGLI